MGGALWREENQAEYLECMYKVCFAHPSVESIIYWDFWDGSAWMEQSGFLREDWSHKPVFTRLSHLINEEWNTTGTSFSSSSGELHINGFFGEYNVSIPSLATSFLVNLTKEGPHNLNVII
ncbi:MAG: hypothetical protein ACTSU9_11530 [Promethearchaeota archaeon]